MLPTVQGEFRVVADPELRFSPSGVAVGNIRLVASSRKQVDGEWVDDKTCWIDCTVFKQTAENLVDSVTKGDLVTVTGRLQTDEWEDKDGNKRSKTVMIADSIGPSLRFRSAPHGAQAARQQGADAPGEDPWATPPADGQPPF